MASLCSSPAPTPSPPALSSLTVSFTTIATYTTPPPLKSSSPAENANADGPPFNPMSNSTNLRRRSAKSKSEEAEMVSSSPAKSKSEVAEMVVTVAQFQGGGALNVIPDSVTIGGTFRAFSLESLKKHRHRIEEVITGQASVQRCNATVDFLDNEEPMSPPTVNNDELHQHFTKVSADMLGTQNVKETAPLMGSEDFAYYQEVIPGHFFFVGMKTESKQSAPEHNPKFMVNEDMLPYGASLHASLVVRYLLEKQTIQDRSVHDEL